MGSKAAVMHFCMLQCGAVNFVEVFLFPFAFECCNQQLQLFS